VSEGPHLPFEHRDSALVTELGSDLVVLEPIKVETDHLLRGRVDAHSARMFLGALVAGEHEAAFLTPALLRRAVEFDDRYADLDLGLTDGSVMVFAERHGGAILTFVFERFRATRPRRGYWRLVIDQARYDEAVNA
jgi:predicted nucleic acid-binding protein